MPSYKVATQGLKNFKKFKIKAFVEYKMLEYHCKVLLPQVTACRTMAEYR